LWLAIQLSSSPHHCRRWNGQFEVTGVREEICLFKIESVNENNFEDIPSPCKYCIYWQTTEPFDEKMLKPKIEQKKREWLDKVVKEFGSSMKIAYLDDAPIGFMLYAPAKFFPRVKEYAAGPPSKDAVFIACLYIANKEARGKELGTRMLQNLIVELKKRGIKAVETFARKSSENNPSGPLRFYLKHNFKIKNDRNDFPLVRLEFE
jgi:GNAT superfamily N-acetyltransferase